MEKNQRSAAEAAMDTNEQVIAKGKIFELVQRTQPDGRVFETARRAPGVRLIIADRANKKVLLTREFRQELDDWDYRLPGGKVFDTLEEFEQYRASGDDIVLAAVEKGKQEGREEAGVTIGALHLVNKSTLGATVEWDLYIMEADMWELATDGQALEQGEQIEADTWLSYDDAEKLILNGDMQEERVALILLRWIAGQNKEASDEK